MVQKGFRHASESFRQFQKCVGKVQKYSAIVSELFQLILSHTVTDQAGGDVAFTKKQIIQNSTQHFKLHNTNSNTIAI